MDIETEKTTLLDSAQCEKLERVWRNFDTVVGRLPMSDISALLAFHTRNMLDRLASPPVDIGTIKIVTNRIHELVKSSPVLLDIDDMLTLLNTTIEQIKCHHPAAQG